MKTVEPLPEPPVLSAELVASLITPLPRPKGLSAPPKVAEEAPLPSPAVEAPAKVSRKRTAKAKAESESHPEGEDLPAKAPRKPRAKKA